MPQVSRGLASTLSAVILSVVTIGVFAIQTDQGPEGAIKRMHQGISGRNATLAFGAMATPQTQESAILVNLISEWTERRGAKIQQIAVEPNTRSRTRAIVGVQYSFPNNREATMLFITVRVGSLWKIDAASTLQNLVQLQAPQNGLN